MSGPLSSSLADAFGLVPSPLQSAVAAEAADSAERRAIARAGSSVYRTLSLPDEAEEGAGEFRAARNRRQQQDVATPSALIRRATLEWPDKCAAVAALAVLFGVQKGEAWLQVVEAGILALQDNAKEEFGDEACGAWLQSRAVGR